MCEQRKNSSKIIANLTTQNTDEHPISSNTFQKQLSVQDKIKINFSKILKNDSITVTDNTSMTETLLMRDNKSAAVTTSRKRLDGYALLLISFIRYNSSRLEGKVNEPCFTTYGILIFF
jgi:hypothetical protein